MSASREMEAFFAAYERAVNALRSEDLESFYGDTCLGAAPGFAAATTGREQIQAALAQVVESYRSSGRAVRLVALDERQLGESYSFVTVSWTAAFAAAREPVPFEVTYLVQRGDPNRIVAFVSHEDERAVLAARGVMVG